MEQFLTPLEEAKGTASPTGSASNPGRANHTAGRDRVADLQLARRWLSELTYVSNDHGGREIMWCVMEGFDPNATHVQFAGLSEKQIETLVWHHEQRDSMHAAHLEPRVPFSAPRWDAFTSQAPFDAICLARSPAFTPPASDALLGEIRRQFMGRERAALSHVGWSSSTGERCG